MIKTHTTKYFKMSNEPIKIKKEANDGGEEAAKRQKMEEEPLDAKLDKLNEQIKLKSGAHVNIGLEVEKLRKEKNDLLRQKQKIYFMILCFTGDPIHLAKKSTHKTGLFSTLEKAMHWLPKCGRSHAMAGVVWHYGIWPVDSNSGDIDFEILDKPLYDFPYK